MNFDSEKIGFKNSSAHELLSKKYATFFTIYGQKWRQIFEPIKTLDVIFGHETSSCNQFWIENSELKFNNLERSYGVFSIFKQ